MSISDPLNSHDFFHDGLGLSLKRGKYGFMNKQGKTVIKRRFTYAEDFSEGLAVVGVANARLGFIDTKGTFVIPPVFDGATSFANKLAAVKIDPRLVAEDGTISASAIEEAIKYDPHAGMTPKVDPNAPAEEEKDKDGNKKEPDAKDAAKTAPRTRLKTVLKTLLKTHLKSLLKSPKNQLRSRLKTASLKRKPLRKPNKSSKFSSNFELYWGLNLPEPGIHELAGAACCLV